ncbi:MAG: OsmC family protein [Thermoleophilia bacterium]|nr:OsmC family protein [Thermoleophilia bacterium]
MEIAVSFPGNMRVTATIGDHEIVTDQCLADGGDASAPEPFDLFLASIATCAGVYAISFMKARDIDPKDSRLVMTVERDQRTRRVTHLELTLHLPDGFPEKYRAAVRRAMDKCSVKRVLLDPPTVSIGTTTSA